MSYADLSPKGLVELVCDGHWEDLTVEQAGQVDHALRQYQQTLYALDAALEAKVRRIVEGNQAGLPQFVVQAGRMLRVK